MLRRVVRLYRLVGMPTDIEDTVWFNYENKFDIPVKCQDWKDMDKPKEITVAIYPGNVVQQLSRVENEFVTS